jgi:RNA polymerase sigma-70 factor (ECF subfamily)
VIPDPVPPDEDAALMLLVRQGDVAAFTQLVDRWKQPVTGFVYRLLPDADEAEDIAQGVFIQLWKTASRYERQARFSTFLFTIARNLCLNEIRRRTRHPAESLDARLEPEGESVPGQFPDAGQVPADEESQRRELVTKVDEALADLPEKQRVALALCREGDLSYEEIAVVLGTTVPATKSLIHRAREILKLRLKAYLTSGAWEPSGGGGKSV